MVGLLLVELLGAFAELRLLRLQDVHDLVLLALVALAHRLPLLQTLPAEHRAVLPQVLGGRAHLLLVLTLQLLELLLLLLFADRRESGETALFLVLPLRVERADRNRRPPQVFQRPPSLRAASPSPACRSPSRSPTHWHDYVLRPPDHADRLLLRLVAGEILGDGMQEELEGCTGFLTHTYSEQRPPLCEFIVR